MRNEEIVIDIDDDGERDWHGFFERPADAVENFDPDQERDDDGKWTDTGGDGGGAVGVQALPLPPKNAPEEVKQLYRDRQRAYTRMKNAKTDEERTQRKAEFDAATDRLNNSKIEHPEWHKKGPEDRAGTKKDDGGKDGGGKKSDGGKTDGGSSKPEDTGGKSKGGRQDADDVTPFQSAANTLNGVTGANIRVMNRSGTRVDTPSDARSGSNDVVKHAGEEAYTRIANQIADAHRDMHWRFGGLDGIPHLSAVEMQDTYTLDARNSEIQSDRSCAGYYSPSRVAIRMSFAGDDYSDNTLRVGPRSNGTTAYGVCESSAAVYRHEYGHHIDHKMSGTAYRDWGRVYYAAKTDAEQSSNSDDCAWFSKNVSDYAGTNKGEAFAESFSAWVHPKYKSGMLPESVEGFMRTYFPRKGK